MVIIQSKLYPMININFQVIDAFPNRKWCRNGYYANHLNFCISYISSSITGPVTQFIVAQSNSIRGFVRPSVHLSICPSYPWVCPSICWSVQNIAKTIRIQVNSGLAQLLAGLALLEKERQWKDFLMHMHLHKAILQLFDRKFTRRCSYAPRCLLVQTYTGVTRPSYY